jgi:hypothetical protein
LRRRTTKAKEDQKPKRGKRIQERRNRSDDGALQSRGERGREGGREGARSTSDLFQRRNMEHFEKLEFQSLFLIGGLEMEKKIISPSPLPLFELIKHSAAHHPHTHLSLLSLSLNAHTQFPSIKGKKWQSDSWLLWILFVKGSTRAIHAHGNHFKTQNRRTHTREKEVRVGRERARLNQGDGKDARRILLERETWNPRRRSTRERLERGSGSELLTDRACGIAHNEISARNLSHFWNR